MLIIAILRLSSINYDASLTYIFIIIIIVFFYKYKQHFITAIPKSKTKLLTTFFF